MVFDLGGGTFDVTVLEMFEGVLEVKASSGDNRLGGKDFDQSLVRWLTERFEEKNQTISCHVLKGIETKKVICSCPDCVRDAARLAEEIVLKKED